MTVLIRARLLKGGSGERYQIFWTTKSEELNGILDTLYHTETWDLCLRRCMLISPCITSFSSFHIFRVKIRKRFL